MACILAGFSESVVVHPETHLPTVQSNPETMKPREPGKNKMWQQLTNQDVRYTRAKSKSAIYAFIMGWNDAYTLKSLKANSSRGSVELLGFGPVEYSINAEGQIFIKFPNLPEDKRPCKHAYCFKISGFEPTLQSSVDKSWQLFRSGGGKSGRSVISLETEDQKQ